MNASRFNRKVGKWHGGWIAFWHRTKTTPKIKDVLTRQARRSIARIKAWSLMSGANALRGDFGIIPRYVRRDMALTLAKRKVPSAIAE